MLLSRRRDFDLICTLYLVFLEFYWVEAYKSRRSTSTTSTLGPVINYVSPVQPEATTDDPEAYVPEGPLPTEIIVPNVQDPIQNVTYQKQLINATDEEKKYTAVVLGRDKCVEPGESYAQHCPGSSLTVRVYNLAPSDMKNVSLETKFRINEQNKRLMLTLIKRGVYGYDPPQHAPSLGFKLLASSVALYTRLCPIVPEEFVTNAYTLFHDLHWESSQGRYDMLTLAEYKWISKLLGRCSVNIKPLHIRTDRCGEKFISSGNCTNYVCTNHRHEFNLLKSDPLVDMMWKVYEMVHSECFPAFEESYRMFHKYSQAIMDVWSKDIRLRWFNQLADDNFWVRALGPSYETHLVNMERCNQANTARSFFNVRLGRETIPKRLRLYGGNEYSY